MYHLIDVIDRFLVFSKLTELNTLSKYLIYGVLFKLVYQYFSVGIDLGLEKDYTPQMIDMEYNAIKLFAVNGGLIRFSYSEIISDIETIKHENMFKKILDLEDGNYTIRDFD